MADYIPVFPDWLKATELLGEAEKGRLIDALVLYAFGGDYAGLLRGNEKFVFGALSTQIDRHFDSLIRQKERGAMGGRPKKTGVSDEKPTFSDENPGFEKKANNNNNDNDNNNNNENENENDNDNDNDNGVGKTRARADTPRTRFSPPTLEEVKAYCWERRSNVDAQRFVDFYASKGWKVGNQPMKDWKACVRTWEQRDDRRYGQSSGKSQAQAWLDFADTLEGE